MVSPEKSQFRATVTNVSDWLSSKADSFEKQERYAEAIPLLKKLLDRKMLSGQGPEELAELHFRLGKLHFRLQRRIKCVFHLKAAIQYKSSEPQYHELYGRCFLLSGHWRVASHQFEKALHSKKDSPELWVLYAWSCLKLKDKKKAVRAAAKSLQLPLKPARADTVFPQLAQIFVETGSWKELSALFKKWKKLAPESRSTAFRQYLEASRRKYRLSFQGAVHHFMRRRIKFDGKPFQLRHLQEAERLWLRFCEKENRFASKRAHLRLTKVWAAASLLLSLKSMMGLAPKPQSADDLHELVAKELRVAAHEVEAASKILQGAAR